MSKFQFSNVVVVDDDKIGVIVKSWGGLGKEFSHDVYVRGYNGIREYPESAIQHFVYSKHLSDEELAFY